MQEPVLSEREEFLLKTKSNRLYSFHFHRKEGMASQDLDLAIVLVKKGEIKIK